MRIRPITFRGACEFVDLHHRHHRRPQGHKFSLAAIDGARVAGVVIVGRPVARGLDDGVTAEVTRLCTDGTPNAASMLYAAARRVAQAMGYERILTYTLATEAGASLIAAGWVKTAAVEGRGWGCASRPRTDKHPTTDKARWEAA